MKANLRPMNLGEILDRTFQIYRAKFLVFAGIAALAAILVAAQARADGPVPAVPAPAASHSHEASLQDYRSHLLALASLVEACAKARDTKTCDPSLVGQDDRVPLGEAANAERRLVRYGWLRVLLSEAQNKDVPSPTPGAKGAPAQESTQPPLRTTTELLLDAETRLAHDLAQSDAPPVPPPVHTQERDAMRGVLAGRDFRNLEEPTARDTMLEQFGNWLNRLWDGAAKLKARSAWVGRLIVWGFILAVCVALAWGLLQLERRWRIRLVPEDGGPAASAASARDWQLWLGDARKAADASQWREAIHSVYWAAISRLESKRLWPADRTRTPREYLALVAPEDPRRAGLAALTGSFERIWYGGRPAGESDYLKAEQVAAALISGSGSSRIGVAANGVTGGAAR
jgi:hypothetical protein